MTAAITLVGDAPVLVRQALLARLVEGTDALNQALVVAGHERSSDAHTAYQELCATGGLLDLVGWHGPPCTPSVALCEPGQARLVIDALTSELLSTAEDVGIRRRLGEEHGALAAEKHWQRVHAALWHVEAQAAGARMHDAGRDDAP